MLFLTTIPNDVEGQQFLKTLRGYLKTTRHGVRARGRGHRHGNRKFNQDLPIDKAERLALYIFNKPTFRFKKVKHTVVNYVKVPTKWASYEE